MSVTQTATASKVKRAAIYPRVSTGQQEQEGTSLGTQEDRCRLYAAERGYVVDEAHVYREVHTGTELWERPQLTRLREAVRAHEVDVVIAYALDRLSRNQNHVGVLVDEIERYGARLELVTERFEDTVVGTFMRSAKAFAAELEAEKIRERTIRGKRARLQAGKLLPGWKPPYGYVWRDEEHAALDIDPATAPIVGRIFRDASEGHSLLRIARDLTSDGVPRPSDRGRPRWSFSTVAYILDSATYTGLAAGWRRATKGTGDGKRWHDESEQVALGSDLIPPLVDRALFEDVKRQRALNAERATRNNRTPDVALLRGGFARCGLCGGVMQVGPGRGRSLLPAYRCSRGTQVTGDCRRHAMLVHLLDAIVWERVVATLTRPEVIAEQLARYTEDDPSVADLAALDHTLAGVMRQQANLVDQLANVAGAVAALVVEKVNALDTRRLALVAERATVAQRHEAWIAARDQLRQITDWCRDAAEDIESATYEQKRRWLDALGVEVKVWPVGSPERWVVTASLPPAGTTMQLASSTSIPYSTSRVARKSISSASTGPTACAPRFAMATSTIAGH